MINPIKILIVEDRVIDAELALREISKSVSNFVFERVETEKEYIDALSSFQLFQALIRLWRLSIARIQLLK